jgi:integrase
MPAISEKIVQALPVPESGNKVHFFSYATLQGKEAPAGFGVRCTAAGTKTFVWLHRKEGKQFLETIGPWGPKGSGLTVYEAICKCIDRRKLVDKGVDKKGKDVDHRPKRTQNIENSERPAGLDIAGMIDMFVERYIKQEKLRSGDQYESAFERLVKPEIGNIGIYDIRRSHVVNMLDEIADESGPVMAARTLAYFRKACNWYAIRDDKFLTPIVKGMGGGDSKGRERILDDDEIRDLWAALETVMDVPVCYPRYVKTLLLTATRRNESACMHSTEMEGDLWTIPGARYKRLPKHAGLDHVIPLSAMARALIGEKPEGAQKNSWYIFSTTEGEKPFSGFSKAKQAVDDKIAAIRAKDGRAAMPRWVLHDLRRTARTLMSRAGVQPDHAERCLGHIIGGVRGTYDRFEFTTEKRDVFEKLAAMVDRILNPPESNVVPLRSA